MRRRRPGDPAAQRPLSLRRAPATASAPRRTRRASTSPSTATGRTRTKFGRAPIVGATAIRSVARCPSPLSCSPRALAAAPTMSTDRECYVVRPRHDRDHRHRLRRQRAGHALVHRQRRGPDLRRHGRRLRRPQHRGRRARRSRTSTPTPPRSRSPSTPPTAAAAGFELTDWTGTLDGFGATVRRGQRVAVRDDRLDRREHALPPLRARRQDRPQPADRHHVGPVRRPRRRASRRSPSAAPSPGPTPARLGRRDVRQARPLVRLQAGQARLISCGRVPFSVQLGLFFAFLTALGSVLGFFLKHKGAVQAPPVEWRRPLHSTIALFRSPIYTIGCVVATTSWGFHVLALGLAPISVVQATIAGGLVLVTVVADRALRAVGHAPRVDRRRADGRRARLPGRHARGHGRLRARRLRRRDVRGHRLRRDAGRVHPRPPRPQRPRARGLRRPLLGGQRHHDQGAQRQGGGPRDRGRLAPVRVRDRRAQPDRAARLRPLAADRPGRARDRAHQRDRQRADDRRRPVRLPGAAAGGPAGAAASGSPRSRW